MALNAKYQPIINLDDYSNASLRNLLKNKGEVVNIHETRENIVTKLLKIDSKNVYETTATINLRKKLEILDDEKLHMCLKKYKIPFVPGSDRAKLIDKIVNFVHKKRANNVGETNTAASFSYPMKSVKVNMNRPTLLRSVSLNEMPNKNDDSFLTEGILKEKIKEDALKHQDTIDQESTILNNLMLLPEEKIRSLCDDKYHVAYDKDANKTELIILLMAHLRNLRIQAEKEAEQAEAEELATQNFFPKQQHLARQQSQPQPQTHRTPTNNNNNNNNNRNINNNRLGLRRVKSDQNFRNPPPSRCNSRENSRRFESLLESDQDSDSDISIGSPTVIIDQDRQYKVTNDGKMKVLEMVSTAGEGKSSRLQLLESKVSQLTTTEIRRHLTNLSVHINQADYQRSEMEFLLVEKLKKKPQRSWPF